MLQNGICTTPNSPITNTDYGYTGQRNLDDNIGLMDYKARFYSPVLNRFIQPDTIVPNPMNPQAFNRFSYVTNRPINFNDPTGHAYCDYINNQNREDCEGGQWQIATSKGFAKGYLRSFLNKRYNWNVAEDFSEDELKVIRQTAYDIEKYADGLTGGNGQEWMLFFLGNTNITHGKNTDQASTTIPIFGNNTIYLGQGWLNKGTSGWDPHRLLAHEFGHIWDINTSYSVSYLGAIGGVADGLNNLIGGDIGKSPFQIRYNNVYPESPYIPRDYLFSPNFYANTSTADYLAETFALSIYNPSAFNTTQLQISQGWMEFFIATQSSLMQ